MKTPKILIAASVLLCAISAHAQTDTLTCRQSLPSIRAVTSSYALEAGVADIADTYLTPLHYKGIHAAFRYERTQPMRFSPKKWIMQLRLGAVFDSAENPAGNSTMLNGELDAAWYMMRRFDIGNNLSIGIGGGSSLNLGSLYLRRNGNNPAAVKAGITVDAAAYASWRCKIGRLPITLRYQPTLPVTGAFFSPDYGQLYYQIYLGETSGLCHAAWWGNYFMFDNLLTADLHFGNTALRIGYHNTTFSSKVNNIVAQDITHAIVIGVTTQWISLRPDSHRINADIISAY